MWIGAGSARGSRLPLVALLAILVSIAAGVVPDDVWAPGLSDPLDDDGLAGWVDREIGAIADLIPPPRLRPARLPVAGDPVSTDWTGLTPTDRAPPRG
jgi:hypothetical protein